VALVPGLSERPPNRNKDARDQNRERRHFGVHRTLLPKN
jgi:hypothetical protein